MATNKAITMPQLDMENPTAQFQVKEHPIPQPGAGEVSSAHFNSRSTQEIIKNKFVPWAIFFRIGTHCSGARFNGSSLF